jgi:hypothetical protein
MLETNVTRADMPKADIPIPEAGHTAPVAAAYEKKTEKIFFMMHKCSVSHPQSGGVKKRKEQNHGTVFFITNLCKNQKFLSFLLNVVIFMFS